MLAQGRAAADSRPAWETDGWLATLGLIDSIFGQRAIGGTLWAWRRDVHADRLVGIGSFGTPADKATG